MDFYASCKSHKEESKCWNFISNETPKIGELLDRLPLHLMLRGESIDELVANLDTVQFVKSSSSSYIDHNNETHRFLLPFLAS
ncbi:hypothetical protein OUZ56_024812 [Daphnia magna]|uniref:Uncharacterized protein n=1 Tax=Daphnia magna TaxID=35525 RepID=A0ABQ9ZI36_9CRUS|nr:hypothetical protein OUZ56_024812 [Daphnia magna]